AGGAVPEDPAPAAAPVAPPAPVEVARAAFRSLEHATTGEAVVSELPDGSRILRFEGFDTSNGPDLRVYLSAGSSDAAFGREYGEDFVELGRLKGNIGNQNYEIPASTDLAKYRNAVVWCKRFSVGFGVATLG
ncbi:MAG TPA: DM13 domain-containing protein, partial [Actinomycetota bacterium]|nr:DM13 domain-containing protein [Actinomycetota bacterium]